MHATFANTKRHISGYLVALCLLLGLGLTAPSQAVYLQPKLGVRILFKALSYDENLTKRCPHGLNVVIGAFEPSSESRRIASEILTEMRSLGSKKVRGLKLTVNLAQATSAVRLLDQVQAEGDNTILLSTGWPVDQVRRMVSLAKSKHIIVLASDIAQVKAGAALGTYLKKGRPKIAIHLTSALEQGIKFDSGLLALADIIK